MILPQERAPTDGPLHYQMVNLLQFAQQSNTLLQLQSYAPQIFNGTEFGQLIPSGPLLPRTWIVWDATTKSLLIMMQGMINNDKVGACLAGWNDPLYAGNGYLYPYSEAARQIIALMPAFTGLQPWNEVRIIGHSYGGAVAPWVADTMLGIGNQTQLKIYTYGAPKPSLRAAFSATTTRATRRVFNALDPVPLLPLSYDELGQLWTITGVPLARRWSRWGQSESGLADVSSGNLTPLNNPIFQPVAGPIFTLVTWMIGTQAFGADRHSLGSYITLMNAIGAPEVTTTLPETMRVHNHRTAPTAVQLQEEEAMNLGAVGQVVAANQRDAMIGIQAGVPQVAGEIFHGRVVNGQQAIIYDGDVVTYVKTRRARRALVRKLNRNLRGE